MANGTEDKALVASSEFDPTGFITGMDAMTASLTEFSAQEDELKTKLADSTKALNDNKTALAANKAQIDALDKSSATYKKDLDALNASQKQLRADQKGIQDGIKATKNELVQVNASAKTYKDALTGITTVARQVQNDLKGKSIFDLASLNSQVQQITKVAGNLRGVFNGKIDTSELDELEAKLAESTDEFKALGTVIDFVEQKLSTLDPNSQEFEDLNRVVTVGKEVLEAFGQATEDVGKKTLSARQRLAQMRETLRQLEDAGEDETDQFRELQIEAGNLADSIDDANARVKVLASDTKNLDFGIAAIRGAASAFGLMEGAASLVGLRTEDVQASIQRLNAIMGVLNGLQEIQNLLQKQSIINIVGQDIATKAYAISQRVLAATLGTTAAASKALNVALLTTGIGALVVVIGLVVSALSSMSDALKLATEAQELFNIAVAEGANTNDLFLDGIEDAGKRLEAQAVLRQALAERVGASETEQLRKHQRDAEELRGIDERNLQEQVNQARAFADRLRPAFEQADDTLRAMAAGRVKINRDLADQLNTTIDEFNKADTLAANLENQLELKRLANETARARERNEARAKQLQQEEDFLKRLEDLRKRLLDAQNAASRQDAAQLAKQAQDELTFNLRGIDREVRKGVLTSSQGRILKDLLKQINNVELTEELKEFERKSVDAQQQIEDQIFNLRLTSGQQRAELLQDQLTREARLIDINARQQFTALEGERRQLLEGVQSAFRDGLISEGQANRNRQRIEQIYTDLFQNLTEITRQKQEELANLAFQRSQELVQQLFAPSFVVITEAATKEIQALTRQFVAGGLTYEQYQKQLTAITQRESQRRIEVQRTELEQLLQGAERRLQAEANPARREALQAEILRLREQISQLNRQAAQGEAENARQQDEINKARLARIANYAQVIGSVVQQVVEFWARANEAEQRALEKSISLQQTRVEAATRIAERGNAEYLRLEEDRLTELQVKQENAARRQIAINAILQASQAIVAFTGALANGASQGGAIGAIASVAAVLALLASGYAIVQSLQPDTPRLKKGTKYVEQGNNPAGEDTIPAFLNKGEAVIPTDKNAAYKDTVAAIMDGAVPAEDMNRFVNSYRPNSRTNAVLDYERIGEASDVHVTYDGRLVEMAQQTNAQLEETNLQLRRVHKQLTQMGFSVNIDKNGFALSVADAMAYHQIQKKV